MEQRPPPPSSDEVVSAQEYSEFRPLLFRALARLRTAGYEVAGDEGLEMVHDFFIDAWPGLRERYDPSRGAFKTYVFAAFVRYVRPRIIRLRRWRELLVRLDANELDNIGAPPDGQIERMDRDAVRRALRALSDDDRVLLAEWAVPGRSERELARLTGISRYKLRQRLIAALARLALAMRHEPPSGEIDWQVAKALWSEERSVADTAAMLGLTTTQVRSARQRIIEFLSRALAQEPCAAPVQEEWNHVR